MPTRWAKPYWRHDWPVKVLVGQFAQSKRWELEARYSRRKIRLEFRRA